MLPLIHRSFSRIFASGVFVFLLIGCDSAKPTVYDIPKEQRSADSSSLAEQKAPAADPAKMQILPGMQESADSAPEIRYTVPEGWKELEPSGIRIGNFKVYAADGSAEITVLTFPGDVGGMLANINRWRDQIGLGSITAEQVAEFSQPCEIAGHEGRYVRLEGENQSILGAILPFHGNTWFFKMQGDSSVVLAGDSAMKQFLDSIQFEAHAH